MSTTTSCPRMSYRESKNQDRKITASINKLTSLHNLEINKINQFLQHLQWQDSIANSLFQQAAQRTNLPLADMKMEKSLC